LAGPVQIFNKDF